MNLSDYITQVNKRYNSGISGEHAYRTDLENLLWELVSGIDVTNEPENVTDCGNPDFVLTKGKIPIGYIEAKDVGSDLNSKAFREQFDRYRSALDNLIFTDYLHFQFVEHGKQVHQIRIGEIEGKSVKAIEKNFAEFESLIKNFCAFAGQTVTSSAKLAEMMAAKARLLQNILERVITSDEQTQENTSLRDQYETFKKNLIHDLSPKEFADIYAQTLAYGMFAARLHDTTPNDFSRQEAAELIPRSNPFLRKLFQYMAGYDIDSRIKSTVDNLADVFRAANMEKLLKNFGKHIQSDPVIHFYETFLAKYDPKLRRARGVWYTPEAVVKFIVCAVDDILKSEFHLPQGLADTSKTKISAPVQGGSKKTEKEVHRVQILDPAAGTGTFLAEVVRHIYENSFKSMQGAWGGYVEDHIIPRLNGFEILMASYAMAHLKLDMLLRETGYTSEKDRRFHIYLTNSLEEHHPDTGTLFASWLSAEANEASHIKRDTPVMVVLGNPPYSVSSSNKGEWIRNLTADYKKDLNEKNINPLSDDYIKFIRCGQYYIEKNGNGVLAYISNNSFTDGIIHRQMRKHLLEGFDKIYILDLHGNAKKKESAPDGGKDENVFDIMQGVSINLFVKTGKKKAGEQGRVFHFDLYGNRQEKYEFLNKNSIASLQWNKLDAKEPCFFFVKKNFDFKNIYNKGFDINSLFGVSTSGIKTHNDGELVSFNKFQENTYCYFYRPFDIRFIEYDLKKVLRHRFSVMKHFFKKNLALVVCRQQSTFYFQHCFITDKLSDINSISLQTKEISYVFPLYLYSASTDNIGINQSTNRDPNLNIKIVAQIAEKIGLTFTPEKEDSKSTFAPIDILDYIYAVLHSSTYRETYKEFLKIDFPRVPYPNDATIFWKLVRFGSELRTVHLLENPKVEQYITSYPQTGDNIIIRSIGKKDFEITDKKNRTGRVWINDEQYFERVPLIAWEFYIGGYQPAQKWLKVRKGRKLDFEDILHYQKIIAALTETDRIMKKIDM